MSITEKIIDNYTYNTLNLDFLKGKMQSQPIERLHRDTFIKEEKNNIPEDWKITTNLLNKQISRVMDASPTKLISNHLDTLRRRKKPSIDFDNTKSYTSYDQHVKIIYLNSFALLDMQNDNDIKDLVPFYIKFVIATLCRRLVNRASSKIRNRTKDKENLFKDIKSTYNNWKHLKNYVMSMRGTCSDETYQHLKLVYNDMTSKMCSWTRMNEWFKNNGNYNGPNLDTFM